jgi:hypothetical protein
MEPTRHGVVVLPRSMELFLGKSAILFTRKSSGFLQFFQKSSLGQ